MPDSGQLVSLAIAVIAGAFALWSQRSAAKASKVNTQTVTAVDREKEAYERARAFDTETIQRQKARIDELEERVEAAEAEAHEAKLEAADAKREAHEAKTENLQLRNALADYVARDNNPDS